MPIARLWVRMGTTQTAPEVVCAESIARASGVGVEVLGTAALEAVGVEGYYHNCHVPVFLRTHTDFDQIVDSAEPQMRVFTVMPPSGNGSAERTVRLDAWDVVNADVMKHPTLDDAALVRRGSPVLRHIGAVGISVDDDGGEYLMFDAPAAHAGVRAYMRACATQVDLSKGFAFELGFMAKKKGFEKQTRGPKGKKGRDEHGGFWLTLEFTVQHTDVQANTDDQSDRPSPPPAVVVPKPPMVVVPKPPAVTVPKPPMAVPKPVKVVLSPAIERLRREDEHEHDHAHPMSDWSDDPESDDLPISPELPEGRYAELDLTPDPRPAKPPSSSPPPLSASTVIPRPVRLHEDSTSPPTLI